MGTLNSWETVDANNNATPPDGWPENTMQYSEVNNTGRAVQGTMKRFFADVNGSLAAAGAADAYTLTLNETGYTSYFEGMWFACSIPADNTGASTINVNGIGVQSITDRAGNALAAGELQSGGVYEFRYDGTNFQLMGTVTGVVAVPQGTFTNSNNPDLVDTDVALRVGAADPDSAQHIEIGNSDIQSKSDATTAAGLVLNQLGGNVNIGAQSGTGNVRLWRDGSLTFLTANDEVIGRGSLTADPTTPDNLSFSYIIESQDGNEYAEIGFNAGTALRMVNRAHGGLFRLAGENAGGSAVTYLEADPVAELFLHHPANNAIALETTAFGVIVRDPNNLNIEQLSFIEQGGTLHGQFSASASAFSMTGGVGATVTVSESTSNQSLELNGTDVILNNDGFDRFLARGGGVIAVRSDDNVDASVRRLDFQHQDGTLRALIGQNGGNFLIQSRINGDNITIGAFDAGGVARTLIEADPDDDVALFDDGTEVARTLPAASGGFEVNNTSTGAGFERVLTTSDLSGGGGVATIVTEAMLRSQQAFANTTLATITDFDGNLGAGGRNYQGRMVAYTQCNVVGTNPGFRTRFNMSGSTTLGNEGRIRCYRGGALQTDIRSLPDITITGHDCGGNADEGLMIYEFSTSPASSSQTFNMQAAQSTSNASAVTMQEGSHFVFKDWGTSN